MLSDRNIECLQLAALGYRCREIGDKIGISENTVKFHMKTVKRALGAKNTYHCVSIAIALGVIKPDNRKARQLVKRAASPSRNR
ncbi:helix-turn-helix transcriptional regulator [uncultured Umboniibacter sp.]|uniref:response regulator transcription factor n=1 Tax=uncultured Umboniibacter sp. TaxID=1798917 RepID=UPI003444650F